MERCIGHQLPKQWQLGGFVLSSGVQVEAIMSRVRIHIHGCAR
ncbi:hypothetical protein T12_9826 [Trichinella patagoniensis]|uniref:Uncharacterized protein n=1 Tax=Trichinella patagoniensis TaxID=990121 RepID=A0A0V0Z346_9BILA|nr:hypothetical protein T12_9826 [Trichinella patagoniensis]